MVRHFHVQHFQSTRKIMALSGALQLTDSFVVTLWFHWFRQFSLTVFSCVEVFNRQVVAASWNLQSFTLCVGDLVSDVWSWRMNVLILFECVGRLGPHALQPSLSIEQPQSFVSAFVCRNVCALRYILVCNYLISDTPPNSRSCRQTGSLQLVWPNRFIITSLAKQVGDRYGPRFTGLAANDCIVMPSLSNCRLGGRSDITIRHADPGSGPRVTRAANEEDVVIEGDARGRSDTHS